MVPRFAVPVEVPFSLVVAGCHLLAVVAVAELSSSTVLVSLVPLALEEVVLVSQEVSVSHPLQFLLVVAFFVVFAGEAAEVLRSKTEDVEAALRSANARSTSASPRTRLYRGATPRIPTAAAQHTALYLAH